MATIASETVQDNQARLPEGWREEVDASVRWPVTAFIASGAFWLVIGSVLALIASFKFNHPEWLVEQGWLTFGRVRPAHLQTMIFGWISMAGFGVLTWLWARLLKTDMRLGWLQLVSVAVWNLAMVVGTIAILAGFSRSIEWVEFPLFVYVIIIGCIGVGAFPLFEMLRRRRVRHLYVSIWYIGAALLWGPFLLITFSLPIYEGVAHATANWWFAHNILGLWITPVGLAAAYYFIPKVIGRPIYSYHLSILGFWTLALFYNWAGVHHLVGGPAPQWAVTISIVFSVMMVIPVVVVALNHHMTAFGSLKAVLRSPTLRFIVFGAMSYTAVSLHGSFMSLRFWQELTHFTHHTIGHAHLGVYAFATMVMFGSIYYIMPRLMQWEWRSSGLINLHFWTTALGIGTYVVALTIAGVLQGLTLMDTGASFMESQFITEPWLYARSIGGTLMTVGHLVFGYLLYSIILKKGPQLDGPTYFAPVLRSDTPSADPAA